MFSDVSACLFFREAGGLKNRITLRRHRRFHVACSPCGPCSRTPAYILCIFLKGSARIDGNYRQGALSEAVTFPSVWSVTVTATERNREELNQRQPVVDNVTFPHVFFFFLKWISRGYTQISCIHLLCRWMHGKVQSPCKVFLSWLTIFL